LKYKSIAEAEVAGNKGISLLILKYWRQNNPGTFATKNQLLIAARRAENQMKKKSWKKPKFSSSSIKTTKTTTKMNQIKQQYFPKVNKIVSNLKTRLRSYVPAPKNPKLYAYRYRCKNPQNEPFVKFVVTHGKRYQCSFCETLFNQKGNCVRHMKIHHSEKVVNDSDESEDDQDSGEESGEDHEVVTEKAETPRKLRAGSRSAVENLKKRKLEENDNNVNTVVTVILDDESSEEQLLIANRKKRKCTLK